MSDNPYKHRTVGNSVQARARNVGGSEIQPGDPVRVVGQDDDGAWQVEPASPPPVEHPVHVIGNVPVRSIGTGDIDPDDPVQIVGKACDGVFLAVPYGAAAKGFDWSSGQDETSVVVVDASDQLADATAKRDGFRLRAEAAEAEYLESAQNAARLVRERDAARGEVRQWKQQAEQLQAIVDDLKARLATALEARGAWRAAALNAFSDAQKAADGDSAVSAGDGGSAPLPPSTASLSAAVSIKKLGER